MLCFYRRKDLDAGIRFLVAAEDTFELLARMPLIGGVREFQSLRLRNLRMWHIKGFEDYLIFYRPIDDGIEVLRVLHGKRDIEGIFEVP